MRKTPSIITRSLIGISAAALGFAALGTANAVASTTGAPAIETYSSWDGSAMVQPFGCPNSTTYGETITAPAGKAKLTKATFPWINLTGSGSMVVRGYLYGWNGTQATTAVAKTKKMTINYLDGAYHDVTFKFKGAKVTPGSQYVLFASIDKDYEACTDSYEVGWGLVTSGDPYTGGGFVYQNNSGDESQWTASPWSSFGTEDVAFKAYLK